jgi:hypothetical protein
MSVSLPNLVSRAVAAVPSASAAYGDAVAVAVDWGSEWQDTGLSPSQLSSLLAFGDRLLGGSTAGVEAVPIWLRVGLAAYCRGWRDVAERVLLHADEVRTPAQQLLLAALRIYQACFDVSRDPQAPVARMQELTAALKPVLTEVDLESRAARGCAGLALSEVLLRIGDVGAARNQLELVADEPEMPPGVAIIAHMLLSGVEQAVGRTDLALGHLQVALHRAAGLVNEESLLRLLLVGVLLSDNRRYAQAMLDDVTSGKYGPSPGGQGTVARLHRLLQLIAQRPPFDLDLRTELRKELRWLQDRHPSAAWVLLTTSMCAGALMGADEPSDSYAVLIETAAELRCRHMDGAADLCDRQLATLQAQLGPDRFEAVLLEAQRRRRALLLHQPEPRAK